MEQLKIPMGYHADLNLHDTQVAIKTVKDFFQQTLAQKLNLLRVSAPIFVDPSSGLNDNLNGVERPVSFDIKGMDCNAEIVHSLAKWKRYALKKYGFSVGEGLYTDMVAIRRDEDVDNIHSIYVDQWDWEKIITKEERNVETLINTVRTIYSVLRKTEKYMAVQYDYIEEILPREIAFVSTELIKMVRKYQPDVIIDNRLEGAGDNHGSITTEEPLIYSGDFASPEQIIPPKGVCDDKGEPIPWELCATMNNHWGYCNFDHQYKTPQMLVRKLVECASKGGNMILNVGPDARGNIPEESVQILTEVGKWMKKNGESIYGCGISKLEKPDWGRYTQKGDIIYAHVYETPLGALPLYGIGPDKLESVTYLADGSEVNREKAWNTVLYPDVAFVSFGDNPVFTYPLPDEKDTVLKIRLRQE